MFFSFSVVGRKIHLIMLSKIDRSIEKISASICRKRERRENRDMTSKLIFLIFLTMLADSFGKHLTRHRYEEVLTELPEEEKTLVKVRTDFDEEKKHF